MNGVYRMQVGFEPRDLQALPHADSIKPKKQRAVAERKGEVFSYEIESDHQCGKGDRKGYTNPGGHGLMRDFAEIRKRISTQHTQMNFLL